MSGFVRASATGSSSRLRSQVSKRAETRSRQPPYVDLTLPRYPTMQMRLRLIFALLVPGALAAQTPAPAAPSAALTLEEAVNLARRNNPTHLSMVNNRRTADAAVRAARGQLLPSADANLNAQANCVANEAIFGGEPGLPVANIAQQPHPNGPSGIGVQASSDCD